jgi:hypothetical protein
MVISLHGSTNRLAPLARRVYNSDKRFIIKGRTLKK